jgi:hypothetical protein
MSIDRADKPWIGDRRLTEQAVEESESSTSPSMPQKPRRTPLHDAASAGDLETCRAELAAAAQPHGRVLDAVLQARTQGFEETPLHLAAMNGHHLVAEELLLRGSDVNAVRSGGFSALHLAKTTDVAEVLFRYGVDRSLRSAAGHTAAEESAGGHAVQEFIIAARPLADEFDTNIAALGQAKDEAVAAERYEEAKQLKDDIAARRQQRLELSWESPEPQPQVHA